MANIPNLRKDYLAPGLALLCLMPAALAQYTPPPPPLTPGPCVATAKDPCPPAQTTPAPAEKFPFPGETTQSLPGAPGDSSPAPSPSSTIPSPTVPGHDADKTPEAPGSFPFPGEPAARTSSSSPGSSSSTSSSSSSSSSDSGDNSALKDRGSYGSRTPGRRPLPKVEDLGRRESEDLEVSRYYASVGNHIAAYMRAKDAVRVIPEDSAAHFALAEAAASLKKTQEAVSEYRACLKLAPQGDYADKARKALENLAPQ